MSIVANQNIKGGPGPAYKHVCCVCETGSNEWGKNWNWYGSYKQTDQDKPIMKMCSAGCRAKAKRQRMIPSNARNIDGLEGEYQ